MSTLPRIALTMGDPAGIGPELLAKAVGSGRWDGRARLVAYGDPAVLGDAIAAFGGGREPEVRPTAPLRTAFVIGQASAECGRAALDAVAAATRDALAGKVDALVTAPVNKYAVNLAGIDFCGHTEYIAGLCGAPEVVMMQSAGNLRIAFVTTHIALADVAKRVTARRIKLVAGLLRDSIRQELGPAVEPEIAVAAINPHAGENGFMGREDETVVKPAVAELRQAGFRVSGPFPPDTLFIPGTLEKFDGIVSMYHDQGHIPFKMLAFDRGVNSTLGLPVIRTSPDHGTAFEIAGRGVADTGSFFAAIELAWLRCRKRRGDRG